MRCSIYYLNTNEIPNHSTLMIFCYPDVLKCAKELWKESSTLKVCICIWDIRKVNLSKKINKILQCLTCRQVIQQSARLEWTEDPQALRRVKSYQRLGHFSFGTGSTILWCIPERKIIISVSEDEFWLTFLRNLVIANQRSNSVPQNRPIVPFDTPTQSLA